MSYRASREGLSRKTIKYPCPICKVNYMGRGFNKSCRPCYVKTLKGKGNPMYGRKTAIKQVGVFIRNVILVLVN